MECGGFLFTCNFDSGNLDHVEFVSREDNCRLDDIYTCIEFNIWTKNDCAETEYQNNNRTWFHFGITGGTPQTLLKFNIVNLNKQGKLFREGMTPVFKTIPESNDWKRVSDGVSFDTERNILTFCHRVANNIRSTTYFAFTYPYSFTDLQKSLNDFEIQISKLNINSNPLDANPDDIYYYRECLIKSLDGRTVDLITISSHHGISGYREPRLNGLFPDSNKRRAFFYPNKNVVFMSARVHPGETPSSFVMNGVLSSLLSIKDPAAIALRKHFVFKLIPMLNPDGVSRGFFRTDTRGVNLNRLYINPSLIEHPTIYAAKALILFYHHGYEANPNDAKEVYKTKNEFDLRRKFVNDAIKDGNNFTESHSSDDKSYKKTDGSCITKPLDNDSTTTLELSSSNAGTSLETSPRDIKKYPSLLYLYIDFHGHASKKGVFMYGNYFDQLENVVESLTLPKLLSINNRNFHYHQCNFSKKNMYTIDRRDGLSKEGSGRVAVLKYTGLIRSYTLECNYNTGSIVNEIPTNQYTNVDKSDAPLKPLPPKYTPLIFEQVGHAVCISILDMIQKNPNSQLPSSPYKTLHGLQQWIRQEELVKGIKDGAQKLSEMSIMKSVRNKKKKKKSDEKKKVTSNCNATTKTKHGSLKRKLLKCSLKSNLLFSDIPVVVQESLPSSSKAGSSISSASKCGAIVVNSNSSSGLLKKCSKSNINTKTKRSIERRKEKTRLLFAKKNNKKKKAVDVIVPSLDITESPTCSVSSEGWVPTSPNSYGKRRINKCVRLGNYSSSNSNSRKPTIKRRKIELNTNK